MNENLKPQAHILTVEEQSKGGKASVKARAKRKELKEELQQLLETGNTQKKMSTALIQRAIRGDVRAFQVVRDTIGEKPPERVYIEEVPQGIIDEVEKIVKECMEES